VIGVGFSVLSYRLAGTATRALGGPLAIRPILCVACLIPLVFQEPDSGGEKTKS